nr:asp_carb_tr: aspartate [uncultured bacterium]
MPKLATRTRHVLSVDQFDTDFVKLLFEHADITKRNVENERRHHRIGQTLAGHILYRLFYKESTRTYESFGFAATHLGMAVMGTQSVQFSSVAKGETLEDTIQTVNCYLPSVIVLRSANVGDADRAAAASKVPIINAGDGSGEHPTQALLDLYTIQQELGRVSDLHIVMGGDLWNGRTVRSLAKLAALFPSNHFTFVAPPTFQMQDDIKSSLDQAGVSYTETSDVKSSLKSADVVYWTRVQKERLTPKQAAYLAEHPETHDRYSLGLPEISLMPAGARLMHPLPRVGEIKTEVDTDPRAAYIRQMYYGMIVRMALIEWCLGYL